MTIWLADVPFPRLVPRVRRRPNQPRVPRFVKISTKKNADSGKHASENMSVGYVGSLCHSPSAATQGSVIARARSPLNYAYFEKHLIDHPDRQFVDFILKGIRQGVDIGYQGQWRSLTSPNWPSSLANKKMVTHFIQEQIELGRVAGPWDHPLFDFFVASPLGAVPKRNSDKIRVIHDLSWPPGTNCNDGIDPYDYSLSYLNIEFYGSVV